MNLELSQEELDARFMNEALKQAEFAMSQDEVPVGAVIVCENQIIARAYNYVEHLNDVTAHAEMQAVTSAANFLGGKYLNECTLYVTLEPCPMCAGALFQAKLGRLVYGAADLKKGFTMYEPAILHPKTEVVGGILNDACGSILTEFFAAKRT